MKVTKLGGDGDQTYALLFDDGDEVAEGLLAFAQKTHITAAHFSAIGALKDVVLGHYDWQTKRYRRIPLDEQVEVVSLLGDIALDEHDEPQVHAHVVVGRADGTAYGGHLISAHVRPTLEVVLRQSPRRLRRKLDRESGLALIDPTYGSATIKA